ncbi:hypothetical protein Mgra_00009496 [Meloidogyne graminicola]|uniref:Uncharacterized protein n=1 Tax=Meloidogyne graminicola TaxID=189291 RepID=A0A8S9Z7P2_9BILA|nr:hypothetical protein Mgra_00009496 [Meloidogyne graminicola]
MHEIILKKYLNKIDKNNLKNILKTKRNWLGKNYKLLIRKKNAGVLIFLANKMGSNKGNVVLLKSISKSELKNKGKILILKSRREYNIFLIKKN